MAKKILIVLFVLTGVAFVQANVLSNAGFESGAIDNGWWSYLPTSGQTALVVSSPVFEGSYALEMLTIDGTTAKVGQSVAGKAGDVITVGVTYDNSEGSWAGAGISINYYDASWTYLNYAWVTMYSGSGGDDTGWVTFTANSGEGAWVAPAGTAFIQMEIHQWGWESAPSHYDNAVLTVPEPATMIMLALGGLTLIRKKA